MLEHMRSAQTASVVIDLTFDGQSAYLNVENVGSSAATNIVFEELAGFDWSQHNGIAGLKERGISYLPAHRTMRFWLGYPNWKKVKEQPGPIRVALLYNTEGTGKRRDFIIDMMQYSGTTSQSAPEDRIVRAIERLRDTQRDHGLFNRLGIFRSAKKACRMCAESIPVAAKICSHCKSTQLKASAEKISNSSDGNAEPPKEPVSVAECADTQATNERLISQLSQVAEAVASPPASSQPTDIISSIEFAREPKDHDA
jgi:hypothetical protein